LGAKVDRVRTLSDSPQIEPIRIPAGDYGHISPGQPEFVVPDRLVQQGEILVVQVDQRPSEGLGKNGRALAMPCVTLVVYPAAIVKVSERLDDQPFGPAVPGDAEAILADALPVRNPVDPVEIQDEPLLRGADNLLEIGFRQAWPGHHASSALPARTERR